MKISCSYMNQHVLNIVITTFLRYRECMLTQYRNRNLAQATKTTT